MIKIMMISNECNNSIFAIFSVNDCSYGELDSDTKRIVVHDYCAIRIRGNFYFGTYSLSYFMHAINIVLCTIS